MTASAVPSTSAAIIVDRLRRLLVAAVADGDAVAAYACFASLLNWVVQHTRIAADAVETDLDHAAFELGERLRRSADGGAAWGFTPSQIVPCALPFAFPRLTAEQTLLGLRNAIAHADARSVEMLADPFGTSVGGIAGFRIGPCTHIDLASAAPRHCWRVTLTSEDMRRIGSVLADAYVGRSPAAAPADLDADVTARAHAR